MQKKQRRKLVQLTKFGRYRSFWRKLVRVLACIVVFCTTYALILPAITMDQSWYCGFEAHAHSESCWVETSLVEFSCQPEAGVLHTHTEVCRDAGGSIVCPWPENPPHIHSEDCFGDLGHAHSDACYDTTGALACGIAETTLTRELICTRLEQQPHTHGEGCDDCLLPELREHVHSDACRTLRVRMDLICSLPEHAHTDLCRPDPNFDLEEAADWEATFAHLTFSGQWRQDMEAMAKSQIGYAESLRNYTADGTGVRKGYTRYGQWFGTPYGDWDAMFVSFCLHYIGVPHDYIPSAIHTEAWMKQLGELGLLIPLEEKLPAAGDLLFFENPEGKPQAAVLTGLNTTDGMAASLLVVAGDVDGKVDQLYLEPEKVLAVCDLEYAQQNRPPEMTEAWAETENYIVTVRYRADLKLPEGAQLRVTEYPKDSETYLRRCEEAGYALEWLLNIGFFLGEEELELDGQFSVSVADKGGQALDTQVTHFADSGVEQLDGSPEENGAVAFASDGFSDFGGAARAAASASVRLELYSYNEWCSITLPTGNNYNTTVGATVTLHIRSGAGRYAAPNLTVTGGEILSQTYSCGSAGCSHGWCSNPVHTITIRVTGSDMHVRGFIGGDSAWENSSVTITAGSGGGTEPETPTDPTTEPTTAPTTPAVKPDPTYPHRPHAVHTGDVHISRLRFYNLAENGDNGVKPLPGCVFEVTGPNGYSITVTSTDDVEILLPTDIPDGTYTIREVSVPEGYMRDVEYERTFTVKNGALTSDNNIGTFINHDLHQLNSDKTAQVEDYNNRIYQVLLAAESHMRMFEMGPVDVLFVVDQSNSMLFPASLESTGKSVQLRLDGNGNVQRMNNLNLDKNQMYYLISDPQGTSTVWCIWYDGRTWMYQDASYYAKAKHGNVPGYQAPNGELAIFPQNRSYTDQANAEADNERSNGGGLGYSLSGSGLGKDIDKFTNDTQTYLLYTSPTEYNRLHFLQEALSNMIYELADANDENRVTLTRFTKEVKASDDMGPLNLTPDNAEALVDAVCSINTDGGTRQDIALKHVYEQHLNNASQGYNGGTEYTYTILITDGAPVLSGGSSLTNLGSANDAASTSANSVYAQIKGYAQLVRSKSSLMTVGLGLDNVEAGRQVLNEIATNNEYYCAMEDASQLVHNLQRLLFDTFKPKEVIEVFADVTDEISDSFYPIAWVTPGTDSGRQFLVSSNGKDWVLPVAGDWLTLEGGLTSAGAEDAAGQLLQKADGTFYIQWKNLEISDPNWHYDNDRIAWVTQGNGASTGRTVVASYGGKDWILLNQGDWITQQGEYYSGTPNYYWQRQYGKINKNGDDYTVSWGSSANGSGRERFVSDFGWRGTFYVKAKEDFIGGNAIDTNKRAWITTKDVSKDFPLPTVNVRLLDLNELSSQVTVYLGDTVNEEGHSPLDSVKAFYEQIRFTKLISDGGSVLNKVTADSAEGLEEALFYLRYALGRDLTVDEWETLINGGTVTVPYTYDHPSSHGPVGEFAVTLDKTGMEGAKPAWDTHPATAACQSQGTPLTENCQAPAETYTLNVVYTAYRLDEKGRPEENVYNDAKGPGTEVGTGPTLETGAGTVTSENVHEVHVISGTIEITKVFTQGLTDPEDRTFTFLLHRLEDGEDTSNDRTQTITIPAGQTQGSATAVFTDLPRGTYTVTEAVDDKYAVSQILVTKATNCFSVPAPNFTGDTVTFTLGNDLADANVIGKAPPEAAYTSYVNPGYGVYGEAVFTNGEIVYYGEIPLRKLWSDGPESHTEEDAVYVTLFKDGVPLLDKDGNAQLLRLDAASGWEGTFRVVLAGQGDSVSNYSYSIREVSQIVDEFREGWTQALLVNDGATVLWYETALEDGRIIGINGKGYIVQYETDENGVFIVRNIRAVELPSTGGMGTHLYTVSGLALIALALLYGCSQRRRRERRASG